MLSAISSHGKVYFTFSKESINQEKLIEFLERLIKDVDHPVFMILDNLRAHHSKTVTAWVEDHKSKIQLFYLPAYSPEYNPDEYLNHDLKQSIGTQQQACTEPELQQQADAFMNGLASAPEHVQSYFDHPVLAAYEEIKQSGNL
jgi:transposase